MALIHKYSKFIPYLYFITFIAYWFTGVNKTEGINAYPILLFGIPFIWQLLKPTKGLNFSLGIVFVCLSSYMILGYLSEVLNLFTFSEQLKQFVFISGLFIVTNFIMALWMIRNSIKKEF
jgi:hypothetical protein